MFKLNTEKELYNFLKILTEESVKKSKKVLKESPDPYSEYYTQGRNAEKNMFEQEEEIEEPAPDDGEPAEKAIDKEAPEEQEEPDQATGDAAAAEPEQEQFFASKDRLVDFVNDIRSAPSIKDSVVSDQINDYYDRLSEEERNVLVFFLRELSKVMTGKASGKEARDPSDPPLNIDFVSKDNADKKEQEVAPEEEIDAEPKSEPEVSADAEEEEDTSAPIKVNESQDHRMLRKRIKSLLS